MKRMILLCIVYSRKYQNIPLCCLFVTPKFCISIVFSFSWGHFNSQEKLKTMLTQNFGVTNKEHYGMLWYFWSGQLKRACAIFQFIELFTNVLKDWLMFINALILLSSFVYLLLFCIIC